MDDAGPGPDRETVHTVASLGWLKEVSVDRQGPLRRDGSPENAKPGTGSPRRLLRHAPVRPVSLFPQTSTGVVPTREALTLPLGFGPEWPCVRTRVSLPSDTSQSLVRSRSKPSFYPRDPLRFPTFDRTRHPEEIG